MTTILITRNAARTTIADMQAAGDAWATTDAIQEEAQQALTQGATTFRVCRTTLTLQPETVDGQLVQVVDLPR